MWIKSRKGDPINLDNVISVDVYNAARVVSPKDEKTPYCVTVRAIDGNSYILGMFETGAEAAAYRGLIADKIGAISI